MVTIYGTSGKDNQLWGTSGDDSIYGLAGDDRIITNDGDDYVEAGDGDDELNSYKDINGQYLYYPSNGKATIYGNAGNDLLTGKSGNDTIYGGTENDELHGNDGDDLLFGDEGNDKIDGGAGNDTLEGGDGNDNLNGGDGNDQITGSTGNDVITTSDGIDIVYAGDGNDWVNSYFNKTVDWFYYQYSGSTTIYGGNGNDTLTGNSGDDKIYGESGNDNLSGLTGNDYLYGGTGNDKLSGWAGNDTLIGGDGEDELNGNEGNDFLDGSEGNDNLNGGDGNDQIVGGAGNDVITTGDETDTVYGGDGDDWVNSFFSKTYDWFYYQYTGSVVIYGGNGNDTLTGNTGDDKIYGESGNDRIDGLAGNDYIDAGIGNDKISGWSGDDTILGGEGNDELNGNEGSDYLNGGTGVNFLNGGDGNDTYIISNRTTFIDDSGGLDAAFVSANFVKIPPSIEKVTYAEGALKIPNWLDALLNSEFVGQQLTRMDSNKTFYFNFAQNLPLYYGATSNYGSGFKPFTKEQIAYSYIALNNIEKIIDVNFKQINTSNGLNNLTFANNSQSTTWGFAFGPDGTETGSDIFVNGDVEVLTKPTTYFDSFVGVLNHEIGHALGLPHPHENSPTLASGDASGLNTVMGYDGRPNSLVDFQILDIAALQYLYGPSKTTRTGNDTYSLKTNEPNFIWDGVGSDTISAVGATQPVTLYLEPGYWGYFGPSKASTITSAGQITVNFGSVIENAIGTGSADSIFGNSVANSIEGGAGADSLSGLGGFDTLVGGGGDDILDGGADVDSASYVKAASTYKLSFSANRFSLTDPSGFEGTDTLLNIERLKFSDKLLAIDLDGNAGTTAKILGAVFGKAAVANKAYAGIGLHYLDNLGYSYEQLMGLAINAALGPTPTSGQVVDLLYKNVVGVLPDAATKAMFVGMLDRKEQTIGSLGVLAAETDLNKANIDLVGLVKTGLEYLPFQS